MPVTTETLKHPHAQANGSWHEDDSADEPSDYPVAEYEITISPNDWNVATIVNFIDSGAVKIPGFQRNYVWDIKRASKLIESIIVGLPIPQIFLYEEGRNSFLVIDGQQRLMSIYYFTKQRFPRKERRNELRRIFDENGKIPDNIFADDAYFEKFNLNLPERLPEQRNKFKGLNYGTLNEYKLTFDLRTIRNVIVKQIAPKDDISAVHEIFNRLNTGGVNLSPQEIRASLYHSDFYGLLSHLNLKPAWRTVLGIEEPDLHMKDIEFLLRGFAMLEIHDAYGSAMAHFLNTFSKQASKFDKADITYRSNLFDSFLTSCSGLESNAFEGSSGRFSITLYESVFVAVCSQPFENKELVSGTIDPATIQQLKSDREFQDASQSRTTSALNVRKRLERSAEIITVQP
ncbi:MAG: DUF262 domain-containing protein [Chloroflexaceae bacterium]|nr:DUF262 domain-containing protein [Chloroflexaceae bacterium]